MNTRQILLSLVILAVTAMCCGSPALAAYPQGHNSEETVLNGSTAGAQSSRESQTQADTGNEGAEPTTAEGDYTHKSAIGSRTEEPGVSLFNIFSNVVLIWIVVTGVGLLIGFGGMFLAAIVWHTSKLLRGGDRPQIG